MSHLTIRSYEPSLCEEWDAFVKDSRNGTFLHQRGYLSYHADRFSDASLLFFSGNRIVALLPATLDSDTYSSHNGLTYGGLIVGRDFHSGDALDAMKGALTWAASNGAGRMIYKPVPHIYHRMPAEEDLYALFRLKARLIRRDLSSTIYIGESYSYSKGRKSCIKKAWREGVEVLPSSDFEQFMAIETAHLSAKHGVFPVHTAAEIQKLASRFPKSITLFAAMRSSEMLGGIIVYRTATVCHAQYIGATEEGKRIGALDACIDYVLNNECADVRWFDFGISTVERGWQVDATLLANKESWGARATTYDQYELSISY
jgi:hypothetical protein